MVIRSYGAMGAPCTTKLAALNRRAATEAGQFFEAFAPRSRSFMKLAGFRSLRVEPYSLLQSRIASERRARSTFRQAMAAKSVCHQRLPAGISLLSLAPYTSATA